MAILAVICFILGLFFFPFWILAAIFAVGACIPSAQSIADAQQRNRDNRKKQKEWERKREEGTYTKTDWLDQYGGLLFGAVITIIVIIALASSF